MKHPSKKELRKLFIYDGGRLINRVNRSHINKKGRDPGRIAPAGSGLKYVMIGIKNKSYLAHRLIWIYHHGVIPEGKQIDHIDHDGLNNRIENLRLVSHKENHRNQKMSRGNKSGINGVSWHRPLGKWAAYIAVDGVTKNLGFYDDINDAIKARKEADKRYGFHENHGDKPH